MEMKKKGVAGIVLLGLIILSLPAFSQKKGMQLIDSLQAAASRPGEDTLKAMALGMLSSVLYPVDINKAFPPANESLRMSEKLHWKKGIANGENNLGMLMSDTGDAVGARAHFERSYRLNVERDSKFNIANNLLNIGRTYSFEGNFPKATEYFFNALTVAESIKNEQKMGNIGNNLASAYLKDHNYSKAIEWGKYSVEHAAKAKDAQSMRRGLAFIGNGLLESKDTAAALPVLDSAIALSRRANLPVDLGEALGDRAQAETDLQKRIAMEQEADTLMTRVSPRSAAHLDVMTALGLDYLRLARTSGSGGNAGGGERAAGATGKAALLKKAGELLTQARADAETRNNPTRLANVLTALVELEEYQGKYKEALADQKQMMSLNDSLHSQESKNKIAGLEAKHTVDLIDADLQVSELKLSNQRRTTLGLIIGVGVLASLGGLLFRQSRSRKKANAALLQANDALQQANRDLDEANRVKARFFGILSHDLRAPVANLLHFLTIQKRAPQLVAGEEGETYRRQMAESAGNLLNTMEGMLIWSKQQMETFQPKPGATSVNALFEYLKKFFDGPNNVSLLFRSDGDLRVFTDPNYLQIIMQNLTANAIKALKDVPDARIEWTATKDGDNTILSISDNGPGIAANRAKALTEDSVTGNAREGFGLHIVRDLAKAIDCKVDVSTGPGQGTTFVLVLPAVA
jgi:signal transduction histidine kinase